MTEPRPELPQSELNARRQWTELAESARGRQVTNEVYHYLRWRDDAARKLAHETGLGESAARREVNRAGSVFHDYYWRVRRAGFPRQREGVFADFLIFLGCRDERELDEIEEENLRLNREISGDEYLGPEYDGFDPLED